MSFQWKFSHFLQTKFSSMEKIAIFANESILFILDSTIFFDFLQETIIHAHLRLYLWNPP